MTVLVSITETLLRGNLQASYRGGAKKPADEDAGPRATFRIHGNSSETAPAGGETPGDISQAIGPRQPSVTPTGAGVACEAPPILSVETYPGAACVGGFF